MNKAAQLIVAAVLTAGLGRATYLPMPDDDTGLRFTDFPRDAKAEEFARKTLVAAHETKYQVRVVQGEIPSCGMAAKVGNLYFIVLNPRCFTANVPNLMNYRACVVWHELGHVVRGHLVKSISNYNSQLEADFFAGLSAALLDASEEQALAHAITTSLSNGVDPPRWKRVDATSQGFHFGVLQLARERERRNDYWHPEKELLPRIPPPQRVPKPTAAQKPNESVFFVLNAIGLLMVVVLAAVAMALPMWPPKFLGLLSGNV